MESIALDMGIQSMGNQSMGNQSGLNLDADFIASLRNYHWPGNVRELRNVLERNLILAKRGEDITFPEQGGSSNKQWDTNLEFPSNGQTIDDVVDDARRSLVKEALRRAGGRRKEAAQSLGVSRHVLFRLMKRLDID